MSTNIRVFKYNGLADVRTMEREDDLWWVLRDVCAAIGISDPVTVAKRLDEDEVVLAHVTDAYGRDQKTYIVNEAGLYNVIIRSDKPGAKDFKRWVTHEVLPSIRQTGTYSVQPQPLTPAQLIAAQAQVLVDMEARMAQMETQAHALESKVDTAIKVFSRPSEDHWKDDMDKAVKELCTENGLSVLKTRGLLYEELERAVNCDISSRLTRLRARSRKAGKRYKDVMALTKLDAIAADKSLRAVYEGIVRSWQSRYAATVNDGADLT